MKTINFNKKNIFLIIWGFLFSIIVIVLLSMLLLSLKPKTPQLETNNQQEQKTYNDILNKIDKEVDKLTENKIDKEVDKLTKPANIIKIINYSNDKPNIIYERDSKTNKIIKVTDYRLDGTVKEINEYDPKTGNLIKGNLYYKDGKIKSLLEYDPKKGLYGKLIKKTDYNPDGTVKEAKNF